MATIGSGLRRMGRVVRRIALCLIMLIALGALLPRAPVINLFAVAMPAYGLPLTILGVILAVVEFARFRGTGKRLALTAGVAGLAAAVALGVMVGAQARVARENGTDIDYLAALLPGAGAPATPAPASIPYMRSRYGTLPVAVYRPRAGAAARSGPLPILVYVHGGGWVSMNYRVRPGDMQWFADRGYLVISVDYDLSNDDRHLWNVTQPQIGCALSWIAANATRLGGDAARIGMIGDSAGGNLVLTTSYAANGGRLRPACSGTLPRIAATIAIYPVIDVAAFERNDDPVLSGFARSMVVRYLGGSPTQYPERYATVSPATYIHRAAPPTLIFAGSDDTLLGYPGPAAFVAAARAVGVPTAAIVYPYSGHAFDVAVGSIGNQMVRQASLTFLQQHL